MSSNTQSYTAGYQWTKAFFLEAIRHHYRSKVRPSLVMAVSVTAVVLSTLSVLILSTARLRFPRDGWVFVFPGFTFFWFFLWRRASDWWLGRGFDKRPDAGLSVEWEFSQQGVNFRCGDLASSTVDWKLFNKLVETMRGSCSMYIRGACFTGYRSRLSGHRRESISCGNSLETIEFQTRKHVGENPVQPVALDAYREAVLPLSVNQPGRGPSVRCLKQG